MSAKAVVKVIAQVDVRPHALQHVNSNVQVLAVKHVQVVAVKCVEVIVSLVVKVVANPYAKMIALWVVRDNVPMAVLVHAVAIVATDAVAVAMAQLVYSNGRY